MLSNRDRDSASHSPVMGGAARATRIVRKSGWTAGDRFLKLPARAAQLPWRPVTAVACWTAPHMPHACRLKAKSNRADTGGVFVSCRANCAPHALGRRRRIRGPRLDIAYSVLATHVDAGM
jgi:hypothetical protein